MRKDLWDGIGILANQNSVWYGYCVNAALLTLWFIHVPMYLGSLYTCAENSEVESTGPKVLRRVWGRRLSAQGYSLGKGTAEMRGGGGDQGWIHSQDICVKQPKIEIRWNVFIYNSAHTQLLVSWCFQPSQPQRITSGLKTNFTLSPCYLLNKL